MEDENDIGKAIKAARTLRGLTQGELARKLGPDGRGNYATAVSVNRWETGKQVPVRRMRDLIRVLDSVELLLVFARGKNSR